MGLGFRGNECIASFKQILKQMKPKPFTLIQRNLFLYLLPSIVQRLPEEGGWVRTCSLFRFAVVATWVRAMDLPWDPDRYDLLAETRIFAITWCLWDWTDYSAVITFSFLEINDLYNFCCTSYCIRLDFEDICDQLREYRRSLRNQHVGC